MAITEKDFKELEIKLADKKKQTELRKKYRAKRFEYNHPLLFKLKSVFNRNNI